MTEPKVLILSNIHRKLPFFEHTVDRLLTAGFTDIYLQDTSGRSSMGGVSERFLKSPAIHHHYAGHISYDQGMINFLGLLSNRTDYDAIFLIDNDCFLSGTDHLKRLIKEFVEREIDFGSYFVTPSDYDSYAFPDDQLFVNVENQEFEPSPHYPYTVPKPHWENAYTFFSRKLWRMLDKDSMSHTRKLIPKITSLKCSLAVHKTSYRGDYSHYGPEWFHIGNLMAYIYHLIAERYDKFHPDSRIDLPRAGFFAAQMDCFGMNSFAPADQKKVNKLMEHVGGYERALKSWTTFVDGTAMQDLMQQIKVK